MLRRSVRDFGVSAIVRHQLRWPHAGAFMFSLVFRRLAQPRVMCDMSLVVGLDVGTQGVKLVAYDTATRDVAGTYSYGLDLIEGDDGSREQIADWWLAGVRACFAKMEPSERARVVAIGVSGQQHGFVPLGAAGEVLAPVKLWCDTSSQAECEQIMAAVGGTRRCVELAGNPIRVGYTASKVPWTRRKRPDVYRKLRTILLPHDFVNFWLAGRYWMEYGDASGTGWLDVRTRTWSMPLLTATDKGRDLSACLPPLVAADSSFPIAPAAAEELGLPPTVRVSAGGGDNMMAAVGTGNVTAGTLSMSLGTSGTLFTYADRPIVDDESRWAAFCSSTGGWLPLICTMNCTVATERVASVLGLGTTDADELVAASAPGADGLVLLPFFSGERTPDLPYARASLQGADLGNFTRGNIYRAAMEGATYLLRRGYDALMSAGLRFDAVRLTGGGSRSAVWRQMVADIFELPVEVPVNVEGAAFGAALQALWAFDHASGRNIELDVIVREHVRLAPSLSTQTDADASCAYRRQYHRFTDCLEAAIRESNRDTPRIAPDVTERLRTVCI